MTTKPRYFPQTALRALCVAAALNLPLAALAQGVDPAAVLETKVGQSGKLGVQERLALIGILDPQAQMTCRAPDSNNCARRVNLKSAELAALPRRGFEGDGAKKAHRLIAGWVERNGEAVSAAIEATREREVKARNENRKTAAADRDAKAEKVETEVVTEETSRSSQEDSSNDDGKRLLAALGILGATVVAGNLLSNGDEVVEQKGDRLVVRRDGELVVRKDENELLRRPGNNVETRRFSDGSTETVVTKPNGNRTLTIRDAEGNTVRRTRVLADGRTVVLFDDTAVEEEPVDTIRLASRRAESLDYTGTDADALRRALRRQDLTIDRRYSLRQVRSRVGVRNLVPQIDLDGINFATGSAAIRPREADDLRRLGDAIRAFIHENPDEVFLIEGHTDAVGSEVSNLALSDRRAESVALALTEYFDVPPENLVVQGYGERFLKVNTLDAERVNRRAVVRRITPLLRRGS